LNGYLSDPISEPITQPNKRSSFLRFLVEVLQTLILALVLYLLIDFMIARVRVENISMQPTLKPGEFIIVNKMAYRLGSIRYGDIVVFHYTPQEDYIKRVIGLPGDEVDISDGIVSINGQPLEETYVYAPPAYTGNWTVPEERLFVLGDNRNQSSDSHKWGFVPVENVVGKALVVYWPLSDAKLLNENLTVNAKNINGP
jgi:signal peptidase I